MRLVNFTCGMFLVFFIGCGLCVWMSHNREAENKANATAWVNANNGTVNVLYIYPQAYKGATTHYAIVEGSVTKERKQIDAAPLYPIPGEVWQVAEVNGQVKLVKKMPS